MEATAGAAGGAVADLASPVQRALAWLLDAVIAAIVLSPLNPALYSSHPDPATFTALWATACLIWLGFLIAFEGGRRGATPGKRALGIRVADETTGGSIGYGRAAVRRLVFVLGGLIFYIGWLWMLSSSRRQAWHDRAAQSVVVRAR
jgi:uncharacterized RDD family membrane protein YckC